MLVRVQVQPTPITLSFLASVRATAGEVAPAEHDRGPRDAVPENRGCTDEQRMANGGAFRLLWWVSSLYHNLAQPIPAGAKAFPPSLRLKRYRHVSDSQDMAAAVFSGAVNDQHLA